MLHFHRKIETFAFVRKSQHSFDISGEVLRVGEAMSDLKKTLLEQQNYVKELLTHASKVGLPDTRSPCPTTDEVTSTSSQICPMCEVAFAPDRMTHEEFVNHVNGHFSFEDDLDGTLDNYEVVDDSSMS